MMHCTETGSHLLTCSPFVYVQVCAEYFQYDTLFRRFVLTITLLAADNKATHLNFQITNKIHSHVPARFA